MFVAVASHDVLLFLLGLLPGLGNTWQHEYLRVHGMHVRIAAEFRIDGEKLLKVVTIPVADVPTFLGTVVDSEHLVPEDGLDGLLVERLLLLVTLELLLELSADGVDEVVDLLDVDFHHVDPLVDVGIVVCLEQVGEPASNRLDEADECGHECGDRHQEGREKLDIRCNGS